jgi:hypothetical protein
MCVEAGLSCRLFGHVPWVVESLSLGYKGIQGTFEGLWISGEGSAWEWGILEWHLQGRVEHSGGSKILSFPFGPRVVCAARSHVSEARRRGVFRGWTCGLRPSADFEEA